MIFAAALRRLTVVYVLTQLVIFAALAVGVYVFVTATFDFDAATQDGPGAVGAAERGFAQLRIGLICCFAILCVVVPFTSYWMARAALLPLRQSYQRQQQFVDNASHEFRGPLSVITGELELAQSRPRTQQEYRRSIGTSLEATQTLVHLTEDLLLLTRDARTELASRFLPVSADDIVRDAVKTLPIQSRTRVSTRSTAPALIDGAASLLVRALANILDNALKFTPDGGAVELSVATVAGEAIFRVEDPGIGMAPHEVRRAFDRFWRAPQGEAIPGHGLGLSLVDTIARAHRGRVTIESTLGVGSVVTLAVPVSRVSAGSRHP